MVPFGSSNAPTLTDDTDSRLSRICSDLDGIRPLGSIRGEAGVLVCALVVGAALAVEVLIFKRTLRQAARALGFGWPNMNNDNGTISFGAWTHRPFAA